MSGGFVKSQAWLDLLERPGTFVPFDTIRRLDGPDFADLLREYAEGGTAAARVAFQILRTVATRKAELSAVPWTPAMQKAFARQLGDVGIITLERLEAWGRRWREERAPDALDWLYDRWLSYLPVDTP